jgi:prenyltransferase beta subunit
MAWRSNPDRRALARPTAALVAASAAVLVCAATLLCAAPRALAGTPSSQYKEALDNTVRYLQDAQNTDGGFSGEPGESPDPDTSAWAALGLAAAGINPQDQAREGGVSVYDYLSEHARERTSSTELERELLVVDASGTSPYNFGGVNLVGDILGRQVSVGGDEDAFTEEPGESTAYVNATVFAILALAPISEAAVHEAVQRAAQWLIAAQSKNGGWPAHAACRPAKPCEDSVDMTGAAIEALSAAGLKDTPAQTSALAFLSSAQDADGGFPQQAEELQPNVASTAWAVQGILSAGASPETWVKDMGEPTDEPLGYMASLQQPDGSLDYKAGEQSARVWMTAYVAAALAGQWLPIPPVPRPPASTATASQDTTTTPTPAAASTSTAETGHGGESARPGKGVIAGGGGNGAPLFSRPRPQSKGQTPGGARGVEHTQEHSLSRTRAPGRRRHASGRAAGPEIKGLLIDAPASAVESIAPGLRSAGAGGEEAPWLAVAIGGLVALLFLGGAQLEHRRPQAIL